MDIQWTPELRRKALTDLLDGRWRQNNQFPLTPETVLDRVAAVMGESLDDLLGMVLAKQARSAPDQIAAYQAEIDRLQGIVAVATPPTEPPAA